MRTDQPINGNRLGVPVTSETVRAPYCTAGCGHCRIGRSRSAKEHSSRRSENVFLDSELVSIRQRVSLFAGDDHGPTVYER